MKSPLAIDETGRQLVLARSIMHPLIPYGDGLTCVLFAGDSDVYLPVDVALAWLELSGSQRFGTRPTMACRTSWSRRQDMTDDERLEAENARLRAALEAVERVGNGRGFPWMLGGGQGLMAADRHWVWLPCLVA